MGDLRELYQEVILDHSRRPRNFQKMENPDRSADGVNPLCGDQVTVYLKIENNVVKQIAFQGSGCAISKASASIMTDAVMGKNKEQVEELFSKFHKMVTGQAGGEVNAESLGKLAALSGVKEFPVR